jgi:hypothetical protein
MDDIVKEAKELRDDSINANQESRIAARDDINFELGGEYAWDPVIWRARGKRPKVTLDNISVRKYRLANDLRDLNPEIKIIPKDFKWEKNAEVLSKYVEDIQCRSGSESIYDSVFVQGITSGFAFMEVCTQFASDTTFDQNILIKNISNCFAVHVDPNLNSPSYLDMTWAQKEYAVSKKLYEDKYKSYSVSSYPSDAFDEKSGDNIILCNYYKQIQKPKKLLMISNGSQIAEGYSDDYRIKDALDLEINGVRVWKVIQERKSYEKKVKIYTLNGSDIVDETDHLGKYIPIIPYEARIVYVNGKKYIMSFVRKLKEPARMKNYAKSLEVELVALQPMSQWMAPRRAVQDHLSAFQTAHKDRASVLMYEDQDKDGTPIPAPQPYFWQGPSNQLVAISQSWDNELNLTSGMYEGEQLGGPSQLRSGVAIDLKQSQGNHNVFDFVDRFVTCTLQYLGVVLLDLIPKVHNSEELITLTRNGKPEQVPVNYADEKGETINLTDGEYEVKAVVGSANESKRKETYEQLMQIAQMFPENMRDALPIFAKNLDGIKDKEELIRIFKAQQSPSVANAEGMDEEKALAENMQLKTQMQSMQAQLEQANQLIQSMEIDYKKAMDVQTLKGQQEMEKVQLQSETTLIKTEMDNQAKVLSQLADGINVVTQKLESLTAQASGGNLTLKGDV